MVHVASIAVASVQCVDHEGGAETLFYGNRDSLAAFRRGDSEILAHVYRANVRSVEKYVRNQARIYGVSDLDQGNAVADLLQDVFIRAFSREARHSYDGLRDYLGYLFGIAHNCLVDLVRKRGREVLTDPADLCFEAQLPAAPDTPEDPRLVGIVRAYLEALPHPLRHVYRERFVVGRSQDEACLFLGISRRALRTAEAHLRRGVRRALLRAGISLHELKPPTECTGQLLPTSIPQHRTRT
jgi:RNA polymerase sigma factor (sigma-70 family)